MAQTKATAKKATSKKTTAKKPRAKAAAAPAPKTGVDRAIEAAERLVRVQVGAVLEARDTLVSTAQGLQADFGSGDAAEKQIKRFERRGTKATKAAERRVKKTRTRVERELRTRRRTAEKRVTAERKRLEREARNAAERVDAVREAVRQIDLANSAEFVQTQFGQAVQSGVEAGTQAYRRASERITTAA